MRWTIIPLVLLAYGCASEPRTHDNKVTLSAADSIVISPRRQDEYRCLNESHHLECSGTPSRVKCRCAMQR